MRNGARVPRRLLIAALAALLLAAPSASAAKLPSSWTRGVDASAFWWRDYTDGGYDYWARRARSNAGANWMVLSTTWYQYASDPAFTDSVNAVELHPSYGSFRLCKHANGSNYAACKTPSLSALASAARKAKSLGMRVAIKPLLDVGRGDDNRSDRKLINKGSDRAQWFANYAAMLSGYVQVAKATGADALVIGTGLDGMTDEAEDWAAWHAIAMGVRDEGYTGALTFGADWNTIAADALATDQQRFFWDTMDYIGVEAYFPLAGGPDPSVAALKRGWSTDVGGYGDNPVDLVTRLHIKYDKPVLFTGLGYASRTGTASHPDQPVGGRVAAQPQQRAYEAAFDVWSDVARKSPWFRGIWWWDWPANGRPAPGGYSSQAKPAEVVLCKWQGGGGKRPCYQ